MLARTGPGRAVGACDDLRNAVTVGSLARIRRSIVNAAVLVGSLVVGLLLSEVVARVMANPADYLSVTIVPDDVLGIRVSPGTAGFDEWGFRNRRIPSTTDIVAIGDSHTYGNNATMAESWPYVVARATGRSVYSLSLGGYGPNQYYHLLKTRALGLKPRWVVCGLYMGDDFENAFLMSYGRDHWAFLRNDRWQEGVNANIWEIESDGGGWAQALRAWLSRNSVIYRIAVHGPVLGAVKGAMQIGRAARAQDANVTTLVVDAPGIREAFRPLGLRARLDQKRAEVREGMRITFKLLTMMEQACHEQGCRLMVVVIPTKEYVFAEYLLSKPDMHLGDVIADLVENERLARAQLLGFLDESRIPYVDTLPVLRHHAAEGLYTRSDRDMHPDAKGYRVIGEVVAARLEREGVGRASRPDVRIGVGASVSGR